jgi:signal transduction histidine kinase
MARMVGDLLDLTSSRLGTGIAVSPRPMDLAVLCDQVISELEIVHPKAEIRFAPHGALRGEWDPDRLYQAISNLVANALQHGAENGKVTVVADQRPEEVRLLVHNEGPPIPERALEKIFDPMVREPARDHRDRHAGGLGLGLFIARAVAAAHGGALTVTSTEKDGTTFTLRLPVRPMPVPELAPAP